jgi:hypothetical protein
LRKCERFIARQIITRRRKAERNTVSSASWGDGMGVWLDISIDETANALFMGKLESASLIKRRKNINYILKVYDIFRWDLRV